MPFSISIGGRCVKFRASNVANSLSDLLFAAVWSIAPDYSFPTSPTGANMPYNTPNQRAAHFWLESEWHTLLVEKLDGHNIDLWFAVGHEGGLVVDANDIATTHLTLCGNEPALVFANTVYLAIDRLLKTAASELAEHWRQPFPYAVFCDLQRWLSQISDTETSLSKFDKHRA